MTVHTFTPVYFGSDRPTEIGILHDSDANLADRMLSAAAGSKYRVDRNQPYGPQDGVTHSLKLYGVARGLRNVMIEVRSDLAATQDACTVMARELTEMLRPALVATVGERT